MQLEEKTLKQTYRFRGRIVNLREDTALLPNGQEAGREVVEHLTGGVCVAALTEQEELLFVRQFRYPYGEVLLELPAGKRDGRGEDPLEGGAPRAAGGNGSRGGGVDTARTALSLAGLLRRGHLSLLGGKAAFRRDASG